MWILNICIFASSASENGKLILYFTKLILRIQKNFHVKANNPPTPTSPPFSPTPPFLQKYFIPILIAKLAEVNPPSFVKGAVV